MKQNRTFSRQHRANSTRRDSVRASLCEKLQSESLVLEAFGADRSMRHMHVHRADENTVKINANSPDRHFAQKWSCEKYAHFKSSPHLDF